jgi:hypothetical protein
MLVFLIIAALVGIGLGLRFRISVLLPAILVTVAIVAIHGIALGDSASTTAITLFLVVTSLQVSYLTGCVLRVVLALARVSDGTPTVGRGGHPL